MKTLSLTQPWATLVAVGAKRIETRSWSTSYRGPIAIHASKGFPRWAIELALTEPFRSVLAAAGVQQLADLPTGAVLAIAELVDCVRIHEAPSDISCVAPDDERLIRVWSPIEIHGVRGSVGAETTEYEREFGDYTPGRWAWLFENVQRLPKPVPARGSLGLWEWALPAEVAM